MFFGSEFQSDGTVYEKERSLYDFVLFGGIRSIRISVEDRSCLKSVLILSRSER